MWLKALALMTAVMGSASAAAKDISYLALGDSYTIGESVPEAGRWPLQLVALLRERGVAIQDPRIIARTGWTTDELFAAMDAQEPLGEWDFVSLLIGVNNQYRGRPVEDYRPEFERLLQRAIALACGRNDRVIVLAIPDWGVTPFGAGSGRNLVTVSAQLDAYNAAKREVAQLHGVAFVDVAPVSRARGGESAMVAEDGLHPSAALYAEWARLALPAALQELTVR